MPTIKACILEIIQKLQCTEYSTCCFGVIIFSRTELVFLNMKFQFNIFKNTQISKIELKLSIQYAEINSDRFRNTVPGALLKLNILNTYIDNNV